VPPQKCRDLGIVVQGRATFERGVRVASAGLSAAADRDFVVVQGPQHLLHRGVQLGRDQPR